MAGHAQQLGQVDGQEAQKGEGPGLGLGLGVSKLQRKRKRKELHSNRSCLEGRAWLSLGPLR